MSLLPFDSRDGHIWLDGNFIQWRDAKLHVLSHALHYASAVFEGERVYKGKIFKLEEHTARLYESAEYLGFEIPFEQKIINEASNQLVKKLSISDGYLRPIAWRGSEMMGVSAQETTIHLAIAGWAWPSYFDPEQRMKGIRLKLSDWRRPAPETAPVQSKAAGLYMICTLSKHKAEEEGYDDALMLDWRGNIAEATGANVFFVFNNELHTPLADCFLNGITRRTIIDLAKERGIKVIERTIKLTELSSANEVFLTGTAAEVTPVGQIEEIKFTVGEVTKSLMDDYQKITNS
ncbi:MAG: branched-chain amino acid aminotransferase [Rhodospirillaceae bacterium]|nr:branched-chain amino acid aminotransferase [Rhodospirillaceae bacterium]|tara:strand:+ start:2786 stop:3658 length:873 start_codon:yes stop_codon:yes gene_type:complete